MYDFRYLANVIFVFNTIQGSVGVSPLSGSNENSSTVICIVYLLYCIIISFLFINHGLSQPVVRCGGGGDSENS